MAKYIKSNFSLIIVVILLSILAVNLIPAKSYAELPERCRGKEWEDPYALFDCKFPPPPIGRWKAVYTKEFANEHNLPKENISKDFSPGVDYMEMDVQPFGDRGGVACLVNMLVKKPHDIAFYNNSSRDNPSWAKALHERRKLARSIDLTKYKDKLKYITTFGVGPKNSKYNPKAGYSIGSTFAFYVEDVFSDYDYISANLNCSSVSVGWSLFPNKWAFNYAKASVWGKYEDKYPSLDDEGRPKGKDFYDSRGYINVPGVLVSTIFKDVPIGGK